MVHRLASVVASGIALAACGSPSNAIGPAPPLGSATTVTIVAAPEDDWLYLQPDAIAALAHGSETIVFVTASGSDQTTAGYGESGELAAWAAETAGVVDNWQCGASELTPGHSASVCALGSVALVFVSYPPGGSDGASANSLLHLWQGDIASATTIDDGVSPTATYTQPQLIAEVAAVLTTAQPTTLNVPEVASTHGADASDHELVGALALNAVAVAGVAPEIVSFRGDNITGEPANTAPALVSRVIADDEYVQACTTGCAECGEAPCTTEPSANAALIARRYAVGFRRTLTAPFAITSIGQCLSTDADGDVQLTDCATAPAWTLTAGGALTDGSNCAQALPTGELVAAGCVAAGSAVPANERWFFDDDGHIWSGLPPTQSDDLSAAHLDCLDATTAGGRVHAAPCGGGGAPVWTALRPDASSTIATPPAGAAISLADLDGDHHADLVWLAGSALAVSAGDGSGHFAGSGSAAVGASLAVDADSLAVGDLDGDGRADACGRDALGIDCVVGGAPVAWSDELGTDSTAPDPTLSIVDGEVCGQVDSAIRCTTTTTSSQVGSGSANAAWGVDLDHAGAGKPSACGGSGDGFSCALASDAFIGSGSAFDTTLAPWSFSLAGVIDGAAASHATSALADIDGDGRIDACDLDVAHARVACARGQAHGFGPRFTLVAGVPATATTLVLGDLDGDGRADACVITSATPPAIVCALSP